MTRAREAFAAGAWQQTIDVRDFIQLNYTPYAGDERFLAPATARTRAVHAGVQHLLACEARQGGVLGVDTLDHLFTANLRRRLPRQGARAHRRIADQRPLCRGVNPFGGLRMVRQACEAYHVTLAPQVEEIFAYRSTHNDGVYRVYTEEMLRARRSGVITGLPDAYGRGRIIGDYRRLPLYGADALLAAKHADKRQLGLRAMTEETIRRSEEMHKQIDFLEKLKAMAGLYGYDISQPAVTAREAIQWLYFAYLGAIKEQNGAAMSLGRVSTFLDIYLQRDLQTQVLDEAGAQELIDDFVLKLRLARQLRTPEYNELFAGDPLWITEALGGMGMDGRPLVTRTSYRFLHTLYNLGPASEPNLTILGRRHCRRLFSGTAPVSPSKQRRSNMKTTN